MRSSGSFLELLSAFSGARLCDRLRQLPVSRAPDAALPMIEGGAAASPPGAALMRSSGSFLELLSAFSGVRPCDRLRQLPVSRAPDAPLPTIEGGAAASPPGAALMRSSGSFLELLSAFSGVRLGDRLRQLPVSRAPDAALPMIEGGAAASPPGAALMHSGSFLELLSVFSGARPCDRLRQLPVSRAPDAALPMIEGGAAASPPGAALMRSSGSFLELLSAFSGVRLCDRLRQLPVSRAPDTPLSTIEGGAAASPPGAALMRSSGSFLELLSAFSGVRLGDRLRQLPVSRAPDAALSTIEGGAATSPPGAALMRSGGSFLELLSAFSGARLGDRLRQLPVSRAPDAALPMIEGGAAASPPGAAPAPR